MAYVVRPDRTPKQVKNLGWLLRHASDVETISLYAWQDSEDAYMIVTLKGKVVYCTEWKSLDVAIAWCKRPSLAHITVNVQQEWASKGPKGND